MSAGIGQLVVSIIGDTQKLKESFQEVGEQASNLGSQFTRAGETMSRAGSAMTKGITVPLTAIGGSLIALTMKTSELANEMADAAERVNVSAQSFHALDYALSRTGMETSEVERALRRVNDTLARGVSGTERTIDALDKLGISQTEIVNGSIGTEDAFIRILQSLHEMDNEYERVALAQEVFGTRLYSQVMPAVNEGGDAIADMAQQAVELGYVMDEEAYEAAGEFGDALDDLKLEFQSLGYSIGTEFMGIVQDDMIPIIRNDMLPLLNTFMSGLSSLMSVFGQLSPGIRKAIIVFTALAAALGPVLMVLGPMIASIGSLITAIGAAGGLTAIVSGATAALGGLIAVISPILIPLAALVALIAAVYLTWKHWGQITDIIAEVFKNVKDTVSGIKEQLSSVINSFKVLFNDLLDFSLYDAGKNLIHTLVQGIKSVVHEPYNVVRDGVSEIRDLLPFSPAKEGPLSKLPNWDSYLSTPINRSIQDMNTGLTKGLQTVVNNVNNPNTTTTTTTNHFAGEEYTIQNVNLASDYPFEKFVRDLERYNSQKRIQRGIL